MKAGHYVNGYAVKLVVDNESVIEKIARSAETGPMLKLSLRQFAAIFDYNVEYLREKVLPAGKLKAVKENRRWAVFVPRRFMPEVLV